MGNLTRFMRVVCGTQEPSREPCCSSPALHGRGGLAVGEGGWLWGSSAAPHTAIDRNSSAGDWG